MKYKGAARGRELRRIQLQVMEISQIDGRLQCMLWKISLHIFLFKFPFAKQQNLTKTKTLEVLVLVLSTEFMSVVEQGL